LRDSTGSLSEFQVVVAILAEPLRGFSEIAVLFEFERKKEKKIGRVQMAIKSQLYKRKISTLYSHNKVKIFWPIVWPLNLQFVCESAIVIVAPISINLCQNDTIQFHFL
jgi:hypothetical protein